MAGVNELKEVLKLVIGSVKVVVDASKDGKIDLLDLPLVFNLIPLGVPAFQKMGEVPAELADIQAEEAAELVTFVMGELVIDDVKAKAIIEHSLKVLIAGAALVSAIKS